MTRAASRLGAALALVPGLVLAGCTLTVERIGADRFVRAAPELRWQKGVTTSADVAAVLGPPDHITRTSRALLFVYQHHDHRSQGIRLSAYGANVFQYRDEQKLDTMLIVAFDDDDRLLYHGASAGPLDRKMLFLDY